VRASIVLGGINGLNIGLLAVGMILIYNVGRFINFAHAQLGVVSAMVLGKLVIDAGLSWWVAFPLAIALGVAIGALVEIVVIRRLAAQSRIALLIATIGLSQLLLALTYFKWLGPDRVKLHARGYPLPFVVHHHVDKLLLGTSHVLVLVLAPVLVLGLAAMFRFTFLGKAIRAVASNPDAAGLAGIKVARISTATWMIAGGLSAVSAILDAPRQASFDTVALGPQLLLLALGAAAIGGFTNLGLGFAGGIGIGVVEGIALHQTSNGGTAKVWVFVAIIAALLLRGRAIRAAGVHDDEGLGYVEEPVPIPAAVAGRFIVRRSRALLIGGALFVATLAPLLGIFDSEGHRFLLSLTLVFAMLAMSLTLLTGWGGQVSLGHVALLGVGAFIGARMLDHGNSLVAGLVVAGVVGAAFAIAIGIPALRLSGLTLAVTTLGFAVRAPSWLLRQRWLAPDASVTVKPPRLLGLGGMSSQLSVYYAALVILTLTGLALSALRRSNAGRIVVAVRDNDRAAASFGVSPTVTKVAVFALAGFIAAAAGVVWLAAFRTVSLELFDPQQSLVVLAMPVIGGLTSLPGAVLGAIVVYAIPAFTANWFRSVFSNTIQFQLFLGGLGLLLTQLANPGGLAAVARRGWARFLRRLAETQPAPPAASDIPLVVDNVVVRFGGIAAVDGASLEVRKGEIVGLIGTNGAGKTTLLNAVSGVVPVESGSVRSFGRELVGLDPALRAHLGLGRSFQDARLFPALSVRETIQVALARQARVGMIASLLGAPWSRAAERRTRARADELIAKLGLTQWADTALVDLSTGTRRICDLAAQMAAGPGLLLLDEPTAGVAQREAEAFGPLLRDIANDLECAVLIIEHDMPLITALADRIYCLDRGKVIAEGTPAQIREDVNVVASYLGTDPAAIARSGNGHRKPAARATPRPRKKAVR
jgi:ABC-type branched-subunit amino acid transport system ATPase component/ABC-type branched-subunit amino acid transport system permease subunit